jgi:peptidoglycan/xylan/chitin deacetylase (PgdA/CDA1 family)
MMLLTRREFLKLSGTAALSMTMTEYAWGSGVSIPVLMYHDISHQAGDPDTVVPSSFAAQMEWLYGMGYRAISFSDVKSLSDRSAKRAVIITFDDGHVSFLVHACSLLAEYGFKCTINIIGNSIGGFVSGNDPRLSWDECRYLARTGLVEIGCHTYGLHSWYGNQPRPSAVTVFNSKLEQDLAVFQEVYTRKMGRPATILAWPYGMHDNMSIEIANRAGFVFILSSEPGYLKLDGDRHDIPRLIVVNTTDLRSFRDRIELRP